MQKIANAKSVLDLIIIGGWNYIIFWVLFSLEFRISIHLKEIFYPQNYALGLQKHPIKYPVLPDKIYKHWYDHICTLWEMMMITYILIGWAKPTMTHLKVYFFIWTHKNNGHLLWVLIWEFPPLRVISPRIKTSITIMIDGWLQMRMNL